MAPLHLVAQCLIVAATKPDVNVFQRWFEVEIVAPSSTAVLRSCRTETPSMVRLEQQLQLVEVSEVLLTSADPHDRMLGRAIAPPELF